MAKQAMTLEGFESLKRALARAPQSVRTYASDAVFISTLRVARRAREIAPVDTGTLKRAIETEHTDGSLVGTVGVSDAAHYWRFVEFGTTFMAARPFFRPAAEESAAYFITQMKNVGPLVEQDLRSST